MVHSFWISTLITLAACNPLDGSGGGSFKQESFNPGYSLPDIASLATMPASIRGGQSLDILFSQTTETASGTLSFSNDGGTTYSVLTTTAPFDTHYLWSVPSAETVLGILKLTLVSTTGTTTTLHSQIFSIDSTPPSAPSVTLTSSNPTRSTAITLTVTSCSDRAEIFISASASAPSVSASGWQTCSTTPSAITGTLSTGDGTKTLYAFAKDAAGNLSPSTNFTINLDQTAPLAPSITFSGSGTTTGYASSSSLTFTAANCTNTSDLLISENATTPTSSTSGWQTCATTAAGITHTLSSTSTGAHSLKAWAKDAAGNVSPATSLSLTYDSSVPTITGFTVANGATTLSGAAVVIAFTASDTGSGIGQYCLDTNVSMTTQTCSTTAPTLYNLPFLSGSYIVYLKVIDKAGNSTTVHSQTIDLILGTPPVLSIVAPTQGTYNSTGAAITIQWKAVITSTATLKTNGIKIEYLTTGSTTPVAWPAAGSYPAGAAVNSTVNGSCTLTGDATGCITLGVPAALIATQFKIVIHAEDTSGNIAVATSSLVLNGTSGLTLFAGTDSSALGGTALATTLTEIAGLSRDPLNGDVFILQGSKILKVNGSTGVITLHVGPTGSHATIEFDFSGCNYTCLHAGDTDSAGNLYFVSNLGVAKLNRSTQSISVLPGTSGTSGVLIVNDQVYYSVGYANAKSQIFHFVNGISNLIGGQDDSHADVAATDGANVNNVTVNGWTIVKVNDSTEKLWFFSGTLYSWSLFSRSNDGTAHLESTSSGTNSYYPKLTRYIESRHVFGVSDSNYGDRFILYSPDDPNNSVSTILGYNGTAVELIDAGGQNLLFSGSYQQIVSYVSAADLRTNFAGIQTNAGDGSLAIYAQIRSPNEMSWDLGGNAYIKDAGNFQIRKVTPSGIISTIAAYNGGETIMMNTGDLLSAPLFTSVYDFSGIHDLSRACLFFCADPNSTSPSNPYIGSVLDSTGSGIALPDFTAAEVGGMPWGMRISKDGADRYVFSEMLSTRAVSFIHKIDASGNLIQVAGNNSIMTNDETLLIPVPGETLAGHGAGSPGGRNSFNAANSVIYVQSNTTLYTGTEGGVWTNQVPQLDSYTVDKATDNIYYINGNTLYRKHYQADGLATAVPIIDFTGSLNTPILQMYNVNQLHTLYIADGNSIYKYVNATDIP